MAAKVNWTFRWQRGGVGTLAATSKVAAVLLARTLRNKGQGALVYTLTRDPYFKEYNRVKAEGEHHADPTT